MWFQPKNIFGFFSAWSVVTFHYTGMVAIKKVANILWFVIVASKSFRAGGDATKPL